MPFRVRREYGLVGRRYFTKDHGEYRTHNLHIYQTSHRDRERYLAFCVYLRHHAQVRLTYETLKREAYARHPADIAVYNGVKDTWIKQIEPTFLRATPA